MFLPVATEPLSDGFDVEAIPSNSYANRLAGGRRCRIDLLDQRRCHFSQGVEASAIVGAALSHGQEEFHQFMAVGYMQVAGGGGGLGEGFAHDAGHAQARDGEWHRIG